MPIIKKMYEIHNHCYEHLELIIEESFDGKDTVSEVYVLLSEEDKERKEISAYDVAFIASTLDKAEQELSYY